MLKDKLHIDKYFSQLLLLTILVVLVAAISFNSPYFLTWKNWRNILDTISVQILLALGMNLVIATGGIDFSQGAVVSLSGIVMALCLKSGIGVGAAITAGILTAVILGAFNGFVIFKVDLNPFIVTLGTASLYRGAAITAVIMGGSLMRGGKASISGTVIACLLLGVIKNGLTILSISSYFQQFIIEFLLLTSVVLMEIRQHKHIKF